MRRSGLGGFGWGICDSVMFMTNEKRGIGEGKEFVSVLGQAIGGLSYLYFCTRRTYFVRLLALVLGSLQVRSVPSQQVDDRLYSS